MPSAISDFKKELGYSPMFGERTTLKEALEYCNDMLDSSPHKLHIDHITAFMVYINTLITHLDKAKQETQRARNECEHIRKQHHTLVESF